MRVIRFETAHDNATRRVHASRLLSHKGLIRSSDEGVCLFERSATINELCSACSRLRSVGGPVLLTGMGHGNVDRFCGHEDEDVFSTSVANSAASGLVIHLYSCMTAVALGPHLIAKDAALAFIGYSRVVAVGRDATRSNLFVQESAAIDRAIAEGAVGLEIKKTADDAFHTARNALEALPDTEPRDIAALECNHESLCGPWSHSELGDFPRAEKVTCRAL
jgi:hypothetical protein